MGVIYKITSPTGRLYIGKTIHLGRRINTYKYKIIKNIGWVNSMIMNSLQKYGLDAHKIEIIEKCDNNKLCEREIFWIKELGTYCFENPKNMNMSRGGDEGGRTWIHDIERRERQSKAFTKEGNPFFGKNHTKEFKEKKAKQVSEYNIKNGVKVPEWGAEKGRNLIRKPVLCYDKNGDFIKEFISYTEAGLFVGAKSSEVWASTSGKRTQCKEHHFRDKIENYPLKIDVSGTKYQTVSRPVLRVNRGLKVIKEYPSAKEASEDLRIPKTTINRAAQYNWLKPIRSGHIFIYKDLYALVVKIVA